MYQRILPIVFVMILNGCSYLPIAGSGGMAELKQRADIEARRPLGPEDGILFELDLARKHLDMLVLQGAELCFPASVAQARTRETRITRALHGGLEADGRNDLYEQQQFLTQIERKMENTNVRDGCTNEFTAEKPKAGGQQYAAEDINAAMQSMTSGHYAFIQEVKVSRDATFTRTPQVTTHKRVTNRGMANTGQDNTGVAR